jgi:hypothetical protein
MEAQVRQRRRVDLNPTAAEVEEAKASQKPVSSVHRGFITVNRAVYKKESEDREEVEVPFFGTEVARVRVSAGTTRNLGDYNSARVDVTVEMPCYPEMSEISRTYDFICEIIDEVLPIELEKAGVAVGEA